jgi:hypothetical protein
MAHLLRPGTRCRQMGVRGRSLSSVAWTPAAVAGLTYFTAGPTWCFSDAGGTTPCAAGDLIYTWVSRFGPSYTLVQATGGNRLTLRQTAGGKYYAEAGTSSFMLSSVNLVLSANYPYTIAWAATVGSGGTDRARFGVGSTGGGGVGCVGAVSSVGINRIYEGGAGTVNVAGAVSLASHSVVWSGGGTGDPAVRMDGAALTVSSNTLVHGAATQPLALNTRLVSGASWSGAHNFYGFGGRFTTGAMSAAEVVALDAYQLTLF